MKVIGRVVMRGRGKIVAMGVQTPRAVVDANAEEFLKTLEAAITATTRPETDTIDTCSLNFRDIERDASAQ